MERMRVPVGLDISVIIPVCNGGANFRRCLSSLAAASPSPLEIIIVADGETDGSWRLAKEFGFRVLKIPAASGPARARNSGERAARGGILLFVDADVEVPKDLISRVAEVFLSDPDLAAVFGSYDDEPAARNFISQYKNLLHHHVHQRARSRAVTFWAGCGAIRREVFQALEGFDEAYRRPSIEDIELGYRLARVGSKVRLCKDMQVKHLKQWSLGSLLKSDFLYRALPWTSLILRDRRFINDLNLRITDRMSTGITYGLLGTLLASAFWSGFLPFVGVLCLLLFSLNAPLYRFFSKKCGGGFALKAIPMHWFYFLYSGLAFGIGAVLYVSKKLIPSIAGVRVVSGRI
jgi:GT2 family glycosyltransferase